MGEVLLIAFLQNNQTQEFLARQIILILALVYMGVYVVIFTITGVKVFKLSSRHSIEFNWWQVTTVSLFVTTYLLSNVLHSFAHLQVNGLVDDSSTPIALNDFVSTLSSINALFFAGLCAYALNFVITAILMINLTR